MVGFFHTDKEIDNYRDIVTMVGSDPGAIQRAEKFFHYMINNGVFMAPQGFFVLSTAMTESDIDVILEKALEGLRSLSKEAA